MVRNALLISLIILIFVQSYAIAEIPDIKSYYTQISAKQVAESHIDILYSLPGQNKSLLYVYIKINYKEPLLIYWIEPSIFNVSNKLYIIVQAIGFMGTRGINKSVELEKTFEISIPYPGNYTLLLYLNDRGICNTTKFINTTSHKRIHGIWGIIDVSTLIYRFAPVNPSIEYINITDNKIFIQVNSATASPCGVIFGELGKPLSSYKTSITPYKSQSIISNIIINNETKNIEIHCIHMHYYIICEALILRRHTYSIDLLTKLNSIMDWNITIYINRNPVKTYNIGSLLQYINSTTQPTNTSTTKTPITINDTTPTTNYMPPINPGKEIDNIIGIEQILLLLIILSLILIAVYVYRSKE